MREVPYLTIVIFKVASLIENRRVPGPMPDYEDVGLNMDTNPFPLLIWRNTVYFLSLCWPGNLI